MAYSLIKESSGAIKVRIEGVAEIEARLNRMVVDLQRRMLHGIMRRSMKNVQDEATARAPYGPTIERTNKSARRFTNWAGFLKRSFRIKTMKSPAPGLLEVQVQNTAFYALWVEKGHRIFSHGKPTGRSTRPQPYMRNTFDAQKDAVIDRVTAEIKIALTKMGL